MCVIFIYILLTHELAEGGLLFRLKIRELMNSHTATGSGPSPNIAKILNEGSKKRLSRPTRSGWDEVR